ncbi:MAG: DUF349 domain-containing protein [Paludibacter sp.]|nr:DUF349 domain-containing protein [Bacteroidales bacterium]MCM1068853.1 DUF349 domain-containing protein [Prevotella sp.]MCM1353114.1 DUF349 domain-containing protein [Bacteroides sp.]MCM1442436.1 DUF349 domain-containing protein [Muribaculum sp.]MCM1481279.1 DUF349 domain-containing protein [Paludibacter sp.]
MDSLENTVPQSAEASTATQPTADTTQTTLESRVVVSKESIANQFKALLERPVEDIKEQAEQLKMQFYRLCQQEQDALRKKAQETADQLEEYVPVVDEIEQNFRQLLNIYKQQRAESNARKEAELQQNKLRKENIIAQMKTLAESETADVSGNMQKVKDLQQEWKSIGQVPPTDSAALTKQYNMYQEQFYDLVKINNELREYDFRKNLELKTQLCEQAEALTQKAEVVEAFRSLQQLHEEWANIGPVARELREELWTRFKTASTIINKRHQDYFEALHKKEEENLAKKQGIIEKIKSIDLDTLSTNKLWDEATATISELQTEWRSIGFAPKKVNQQIYEEYRALCDAFFAAKTAFYKQLKDLLGNNLQKKRDLLRQAEELQNSTDWKNATDTFVRLQKEWKETGPVARKYSDEIWQRFSNACDHFFEQKKTQTQGQHAREKENLEQKTALLKEMEELAITTKDETLGKLKELTAKYNAIGFVPFRDKDKLYKRFRTATDRIFDQLHIDAQNRRLDAFSKEVEGKDENALLSDRRRLLRQYDNLQQEIKTAENNILFFTVASSKSNRLIEDMEKKIDQLKTQLKDIETRINLIDSKLD